MVGKLIPKDNKLTLIIECINKEVKNHLKVSYLHVLPNLNSKVESYANKETSLNQGTLVKNGGKVIASSPKVV
jgi:hypothetical protein